MMNFHKKSHEVPGLNTSSLPDLIFSVLFFFMIVTHMRQVTLKVDCRLPQGKELTRLTKKSAVSHIYIGKPTKEMQAKYGTGTQIQLKDKFASAPEVIHFGRKETYVAGRPEADDRINQSRPGNQDGCDNRCKAGFAPGKSTKNQLFCHRKWKIILIYHVFLLKNCFY